MSLPTGLLETIRALEPCFAVACDGRLVHREPTFVARAGHAASVCDVLGVRSLPWGASVPRGPWFGQIGAHRVRVTAAPCFGTEAVILALMPPDSGPAVRQHLRGFVRLIAHDLRGPSRALSTLIELIAEDGPSPEMIAGVEDRVCQLNERLAALRTWVEVDLTGPDSFTTLELAEHIRSVAALEDVAVTLIGEAAVLGDETQIRSVLGKVFENAKQAGATHVHASLSTESKGLVELQISDDGEGIDDRHRGAVFEPFRRLRATPHRTGMGLTIAERMVHHHEGTIEAFGEPGNGATIVIRLPAAHRQRVA